MTKSILLSVKPEYACKILNGEKTLEIRKSVPKGFVGWVNVYVTKGKPYLAEIRNNYDNKISYGLSRQIKDDFNGKVVARFWFDESKTIFFDKMCGITVYGEPADEYSDQYYITVGELEKARLSYEELTDYGKGKPLYAWQIKKLEIFDKPKELGEFRPHINGTEKYCHEDSDCDGCPAAIFESGECKLQVRLTKAPENWCYIWER